MVLNVNILYLYLDPDSLTHLWLEYWDFPFQINVLKSRMVLNVKKYTTRIQRFLEKRSSWNGYQGRGVEREMYCH